ncbi:hypothetical protein [Vibrio viridaestus]|uniref:Uncharacterized protein n=1 Tax=Vibrio viridaestus TaxID=2487322 RepID=A0A3N9TAI1_9VIBR|nr:hypothetical protein [Vibrio viridaestus]RQW61039.1 hypothetical protein EES38_21560 [Vibrio viridaestus]
MKTLNIVTTQEALKAKAPRIKQDINTNIERINKELVEKGECFEFEIIISDECSSLSSTIGVYITQQLLNHGWQANSEFSKSNLKLTINAYAQPEALKKVITPSSVSETL